MRGCRRQRLPGYAWAPLPALVATALACASSPAPVPITGESNELARLAGRWTGYYDSPVVGRRGTIVIELEAGRDTAYGDVTMIPRGWTRPLGPAEDAAAAARGAPIPEALEIRFVRVAGDRISGTLQPYADPDCGCSVYTTFEGQVEGDVINGTFTSRPGHGEPYEGTWLVRRHKEGGG